MFSKQNHVSIAKISTFSEKTKKLVKKLCSYQSIILTLQTEKKHFAKRDAASLKDGNRKNGMLFL